MTENTQTQSRENLAETLARELKAPVELDAGYGLRRVAAPEGWTIQTFDDSKQETAPARKTGTVNLHDADSFVDYVNRHKLPETTTWCDANFTKGTVAFTGILNDNGAARTAWRDHLAKFTPGFSEEWSRWTEKNKQSFTQSEFADWLELNIRDFASTEGRPTGAQMLEMALSFEANQDMRFKSAIRLQNGGVQMSFVQDDDTQTLEKMQMFDRFSLGIPVFWNGEPYQIDARLRYRVRDGKLTFSYDLLRADKVLEAATNTLIGNIREKTGVPFFFGYPNV
jgi:uncharacterized protein YfdQ (DUF2303 family)